MTDEELAKCLEIEAERDIAKDEISYLTEAIGQLLAALDGYACLGKAACSEKKLKDGSCIRETVGTCGNDAFETLRGYYSRQPASDGHLVKRPTFGGRPVHPDVPDGGKNGK